MIAIRFEAIAKFISSWVYDTLFDPFIPPIRWSSHVVRMTHVYVFIVLFIKIYKLEGVRTYPSLWCSNFKLQMAAMDARMLFEQFGQPQDFQFPDVFCLTAENSLPAPTNWFMSQHCAQGWLYEGKEGKYNSKT